MGIKNKLYEIYVLIRTKPKAFLIRKKYGKKLSRFKDIHKGKRCFIIGNGPSLKMEDLDKLKNEYTFAANKIYIAFEDTDWRPVYYCIQDFEMIREDYSDIMTKVKSATRFIAGNHLIVQKDKLKDWIYFFLDVRGYYRKFPPFSKDISKQIFEGCTVTYANMQLAVYMGFKEIYLLGVDFSYAGSTSEQTKNYFSDKYMGNKEFGKNYNPPNIEKSLMAYKSARKYADKHGIKIYNATRGGKLEVFDRVDFDSLTFDAM
jgi:hypothetical protein